MNCQSGILWVSAVAWLSLIDLLPAQSSASYDVPFVADATYEAQLPKPDDLLGYALGSKAATSVEIERCLRAWTEASDRARLVEYARSHEGRPLHYVIVSDPANLNRLEAIEENIQRLGDPRGLSESDVNGLIDETPPVAWLAYAIHGDETEGSDAALAVLYHLLADSRESTRRWLRDTLIMIDPLMNPDGRDRCLTMIAEHRGALPNHDDRSSVHTGYWPFGRGNHYLFDLNRDWILAIHPETRGRIAEVSRWNPLLFIDAHGMESQETHLFSPPREPINPNIPKHRIQWGDVFAEDQARRFDQQGWLYYNGEWHEEWYPGYSDAWSSYRGAVGILYEQASIAEDGVRRPGGRVLSYRESVHHHVVGSLANLDTFYRNRRDLWQGFVATRRLACDPNGPYAHRTFAVPPTANGERWRRFVDLMHLQGFDMRLTESVIDVPSAIDQLGRRVTEMQLPANTLLLSNRQPLGHLLATMLEFDPRLSETVLKAERKEVLARGGSKIYDTTAWNLTMMYGLPAFMLPMEISETATVPYPSDGAAAPARTPASTPQPSSDEAIALIVDGADDRSVAVAVKLMREGVEVRVSRKSFKLDNKDFARGSVVVTQLDQRSRRPDWRPVVRRAAESIGISAVPVDTGFGPRDLPDLGGEHFVRLELPRVAVATRGSVDAYDFGSTWHLLDHRLRLPNSHLNVDLRNAADDLSRYNVLILPNGSAGKSSTWISALEPWVRAGGTLIAVGSSATSFAKPDSKLSRVRVLKDVFDQLDDYELAIWREWMASSEVLPDVSSIWSNRVPVKAPVPWVRYGVPRPDVDELKRRDAWRRLFMPSGALLAARVDPEHWLTLGCAEPLPVMVRQGSVLMSKPDTETAVRLGAFLESDGDDRASADSESAKASPGESAETIRTGWAVTPPGHDVVLRMSGLLWPEAAHRLANAAYLTREAVGDGQVILFADAPNFRASTLGSARLLMNAIVYGPGFGARQPIRP